MKKLAYGLLVLVALLAGAVFVLPDLIDWNAYKPRISAEVKKAIGRTLTIDGDLDLDVLPAPRLTAFNARLSNAPGAARADMATLRALRIRIEIAPLLRGRLEVAHIEIVQPEIHLERLPDGRANWNLASAAAAVSRQGSERGSGSASGFAFRVNRLTVTNGAVFYRDGRAAEKIEGLSAEVAAESLSGPFSISGSMIARGVPLTFDATVGQVAEGRPVPVSLGARIGGAEVSAKGIASASRASAEVDGEGKNLRTLVALLSGRAAPETPDVPYSFKTNVVAADGRIALNDLKLRLKDSEVSGKASVATGDALRVDVDLKAARIDADSFLTEPRPAGAATGGRPDGGQQAGGAVEAAEIRLPRDVEVNVDLAADEILAGGGSLRNVRLSAALKEGALSLEKFSALLPGDAELGLAGTADEEGGSLRYAGKMSFRSANLRTLLDWFDAAPSGTGADRLRRMTAEADIAGDLSQLRIENIRMQFDASRLEGGVTLALQDRLSFGASLNVDQFNVDAYVSAPQEEESRAPDDRKKTDPEGAPQRGPLSFMEKFDANLAIRVGNFVYRETSVQGMRFDGTLLNGELTVREASLRNLAGVGARAQGKLSGFDGIPAFKGTVSVASEDPGGLLAAFDVESPVPPERLGRIRLSGDVEAAAERVSVDAQVEVAEFSGTLRGFVSDPAADPSFDLRLDGGHPELVRFVALFSDRETGIQAGGAKLKVSAKGDMDNVALETEIGALDASLKVAGTVLKPMDAPKFDLNVDFRHPDFVRLVRNFDPAFNPANPRSGAVALTAGIEGDEESIKVDRLKGAIGAASVSGTGSYRASEPRPELKLSLLAGTVALDDFLGRSEEAPGAKGGSSGKPRPGGAPPAGDGRWSRTPINLDGLGLFDGDIDFRADALVRDDLRVEKVSVGAAVKDKVLIVERLSGSVFDGSFELKGVLDAREVPAAQASIVADRMKPDATEDAAIGTVSLNAELATRGRSQFDMIKALGGRAKVGIEGGTVKGFDILRIGELLRDPEGVLKLPEALGSASRTEFGALDGTFAVDNGVVRTSDLKLIADAGTGSAKGSFDLSAWMLDVAVELRLLGQAILPPLGIRITGPPDRLQAVPDIRSLEDWWPVRGLEGLIDGITRVPGGAKLPVPGAPGELLKGILDTVRDEKPPPGRTEQSERTDDPPDREQARKPRAGEIDPAELLKGLLRGLER